MNAQANKERAVWFSGSFGKRERNSEKERCKGHAVSGCALDSAGNRRAAGRLCAGPGCGESCTSGRLTWEPRLIPVRQRLLLQSKQMVICAWIRAVATGAEEGTDVRDSRKTESTTDWLLSGRKREGHREQGTFEPGGREDSSAINKSGWPRRSTWAERIDEELCFTH